VPHESLKIKQKPIDALSYAVLHRSTTMKKRFPKETSDQDKMTGVLRARAPIRLKEMVSDLARKRLTNEGQIVREAVQAWVEKQEKAA